MEIECCDYGYDTIIRQFGCYPLGEISVFPKNARHRAMFNCPITEPSAGVLKRWPTQYADSVSGICGGHLVSLVHQDPIDGPRRLRLSMPRKDMASFFEVVREGRYPPFVFGDHLPASSVSESVTPLVAVSEHACARGAAGV